MTTGPLDVVGLGNAIVDVLTHAEDSFLGEHELVKGTMALIEADRAEFLYDRMGPGVECSGGSAANTLAGFASLGGRGAFVGKVRGDDLGRVFAHDIRAAGVDFVTPPAEQGAPTARCLVFVTPDAQRTMTTYLGAARDIAPEDIDASLFARAQVTYLEGYLWDPPRAKAACREAASVARRNGRLVALSLSDPFCVERWREEFLDLIADEVDILFANEDEITSLFRVASFDEALQRVRPLVRIAALTRSEKGSVVVAGGEAHVLDAEPLPTLVDTTGAGDLYAAGFLYGLTHGFDLARCGRLGGLAAAEVLTHYGARPQRPLAPLVDKLRAG